MPDHHRGQPDDPPKGPSALYYALAALVAVLGIVAFVLFMAYGVGKIADEMTRIVVPAQVELDLDDPGQYIIFHEHKSVIDGRVFSTPSRLDTLRCSLRSRATDEEIALNLPWGDIQYTVGRRAGVAILAFSIDRPGRYVLAVHHEQGAPGPEAVLLIEHDFVYKSLAVLYRGLAIPLVTLLAAITIALITRKKRQRAAHRKAASTCAS